MTILEALGAIHWPQLRHAYGTAQDIPGLIRALTSNSAELRTRARERLAIAIYHQGTIYQASFGTTELQKIGT